MTAQRLTRVIEGAGVGWDRPRAVPPTAGEEVDGEEEGGGTALRLSHPTAVCDPASLGSGFRYCRLGRTLLDANGNVNGDVPFADLARYVFLLETGVPTPKRPRKDCPLLGVHAGRAVYLLYNGVLGDNARRAAMS